MRRKSRTPSRISKARAAKPMPSQPWIASFAVSPVRNREAENADREKKPAEPCRQGAEKAIGEKRHQEAGDREDEGLDHFQRPLIPKAHHGVKLPLRLWDRVPRWERRPRERRRISALSPP